MRALILIFVVMGARSTAAETVALLPLGQDAGTPTAFNPWVWAGLALVPALLAWVTLAWVRAETSEATFTQRRARRRLGKLLRALQAAGRAPTAAELETWSALTADLFAVPRAAPTELDLRHGVRALDADEIAWVALWREARAGLFSANPSVPDDWCERAEAAWAETVVKRQASRWPKARAHWFPPAVAIAVTIFLAMPGALVAQESPGVAERARLQTHPGDWAAHHNLALLAQRDEAWGAAAAHWTAAFLLNPREAAIGAGLRGAMAKLEGVDPALRLIATGKWHQRLAGYFSPREWQQLARAAAVGFAVGLGLSVWALYRPRRWLRVAGAGVTLVALAGFATGVAGWRAYGVTADPDAACLAMATDLRVVPSELVEQEKTAPLLAGQIVRIEGHYFGWNRIVVRGGATGWVRRDAVLPLYAAQKPRGATGFDRTTRAP